MGSCHESQYVYWFFYRLIIKPRLTYTAMLTSYAWRKTFKYIVPNFTSQLLGPHFRANVHNVQSSQEPFSFTCRELTTIRNQYHTIDANIVNSPLTHTSATVVHVWVQIICKLRSCEAKTFGRVAICFGNIWKFTCS